MKAGNVKLLAASAVIVALVLVFSYITLGEDDSSDDSTGGLRTDLALGDSLSAHVTFTAADGTVSAYDATQTIIGVLDEGYLVSVAVSGTATTTSVMTAGQFLGAVDVRDEVLVGTETIDTPFGERVCDVYTGTVDGYGDVKVWMNGGIAYISEVHLDSGISRAEFTGTTLFGDAPVYHEGKAPGEVGVGDWMTTQILATMPDGTVQVSESRQTVTAIDGDTYTVQTEVGGSVKSADMPLEMFLTGMIKKDAVQIGTAICPCGDDTVLCDLYQYTDPMTGTVMVVYVSNGVSYMISTEYLGITGVQTITGASFLE